MAVSDSGSHTPPAGRSLRAAERVIVEAARVARLATIDRWNRPTIVPFCFAVIETTEPVVVSVLDEKPKRVADADLARVRNIERNPDVAVLVDRYDEDWSWLSFVHIRGRASLLAAGAEGHSEAIAALREKYPQYREMAIESRPVIVIAALLASSWRVPDQPALSE